MVVTFAVECLVLLCVGFCFVFCFAVGFLGLLNLWFSCYVLNSLFLISGVCIFLIVFVNVFNRPVCCTKKVLFLIQWAYNPKTIQVIAQRVSIEQAIFPFSHFIYLYYKTKKKGNSIQKTYLSGQELWDSKVNKRLLRQGM